MAGGIGGVALGGGADPAAASTSRSKVEAAIGRRVEGRGGERCARVKGGQGDGRG